MSIYSVKLSKWYPLGDELHPICYSIVKFRRCYACDKKLRWRSVVGLHSVPFGNGDVCCGWKCCFSGKVAKIDRRRNNRWKRKNKGVDFLLIKEIK